MAETRQLFIEVEVKGDTAAERGLAQIDDRTNALETSAERASQKIASLSDSLNKTSQSAASVASGAGLAAFGLAAVEDAAKRIDAEMARLTKTAQDVWGGQRLFDEADQAAAGIARVGGVSTLTAEELAKANRVAEDAIEKYRLMGQEVPAHIQKLADSTKQVDNETKGFAATLGGDLKTQILGTIAGMVSAEAIIGLAKAAWSAFTALLSSSISSFAEAEAVQSKLSAALKAQGQDVGRVSAQYNDLASTFQQTTVYSSGLVNEMQALLVQVGNVMPADMETALSAATNLASGLGIDLRQATMLVGKAMAGETGGLGRYGIALDEARVKAEGSAYVIGQLQAKFGGQAAAQVDTYSGSLQQMANAWDSVKEEIGKALVEELKLVAVLQLLTTGFTNLAPAVRDSTAALPGVKGLREIAAAYAAMAYAIDLVNVARSGKKLNVDIPLGNEGNKGLDPLTLSLKEAEDIAKKLDDALNAQFKKGLEATNKAAEDAAKKTKALADAIKAGADELTGRGAIIALERYAVEVKAAGGISQVTAAGLDKLTAATKLALQATVPLTPAARALAMELLRLGALEPPLTTNNAALVKSLQEFGKVAQDTGAWIRMLAEADIKKLTVASREGAAEFERMLNGLGKAGKETIPPTSREVSKLALALDIAGQTIGLFTDETGAMGQLLGVAISSLAQYAQAMANAKTETDKAAAASQLATTAFIGVIAWVVQMNAASNAAAKHIRELGQQLEESNKDIEAQYGSFQRAAEAARRYGLELDAVNTGLMLLSAHGRGSSGTSEDRLGGRQLTGDEAMARLQTQLQNLNEIEDRVTAAAKDLGLAWTDMPDLADRFNAASIAAKDLATTINGLVAKGYDLNTVIQRSSEDINEWLGNALDAGIQIPASMQAIIRSLIEAGEISDANARKMLGMASTILPTLEDVTEAAERYGIALEDLGAKAMQIQITDQAGQLISDWNLLKQVTDDTGVLFDGMGEKVQQLIDDAIRYGAELPADMKPMIQAFIDAGVLVDENGQKLNDLSQLTFAEDLSAMVEQLIAKLDELITKIVGGVVPAAGGIGTSVAGGIKSITEAAGEATKSIAEMGRATEVVGDDIRALPPGPFDDMIKQGREFTETNVPQVIEDIGDKIRELPIIDLVGASKVKEDLEDIAKLAGNVPKRIRIDIDSGDISDAGFKTIAELEAIANRAGVIWMEMSRSGKYSASELQRAFEAWQEALRNVNPDLDDLGKRAAAAGYQTTESLQEAAGASERLWREMVASGRFSAATLKEAWEDWQEDLAAAGQGGMTKAIRQELEGLRKLVADEAAAPEYDEFGKRIFGVDEQAAIDRIKQIEDEAKAAQDAIKDTTSTANGALTTSNATAMGQIEGKSKGAIASMKDVGADGSAAFKDVEVAAKDASDEIKNCWDRSKDFQETLNEADYVTPFDLGKQAAFEMRQEVELLEAAVYAVAFGRSPGGLKEYPIKFQEAVEAARHWKTETVRATAEVEAWVNSLSDTLKEDLALMLDSGQAAKDIADALGVQVAMIEEYAKVLAKVREEEKALAEQRKQEAEAFKKQQEQDRKTVAEQRRDLQREMQLLQVTNPTQNKLLSIGFSEADELKRAEELRASIGSEVDALLADIRKKYQLLRLQLAQGNAQTLRDIIAQNLQDARLSTLEGLERTLADLQIRQKSEIEAIAEYAASDAALYAQAVAAINAKFSILRDKAIADDAKQRADSELDRLSSMRQRAESEIAALTKYASAGPLYTSVIDAIRRRYLEDAAKLLDVKKTAPMDLPRNVLPFQMRADTGRPSVAFNFGDIQVPMTEDEFEVATSKAVMARMRRSGVKFSASGSGRGR